MRRYELASGVGGKFEKALATPAFTERGGLLRSCAARLDGVRRDPAGLRRFLAAMPKGGDIHSHLIGAVYAESYLRWAAADGLCLDESFRLQQLPSRSGTTAAAVVDDPVLTGKVIDAWSMRRVSGDGPVRQRHFFETFYKFGQAFTGHAGDGLADVMSRAAESNALYLELMFDPVPYFGYRGVSSRVSYTPDARRLARELSADRALRVAAAEHSRRLDDVERVARAALRCGTAQPAAGAEVEVRYIWEVPRLYPFAVVAVLLTEGFLLAEVDPRVVGVTLDGDERSTTAIGDYYRHMALIQALRALHPTVGVTLHAGEYSREFQLSPRYRADHIRQAIYLGHASRIGHGLDVRQDVDPVGLLDEMASRRVLVEVCLSSNREVSGVIGREHPLAQYLQADVPVALATDDEGVLRANLAEQFAIAVETAGLGYSDLKRCAFASIDHAFASERDKPKLRDALTRAYVAFEARESPVCL
jgi:adenosine deaminase